MEVGTIKILHQYKSKPLTLFLVHQAMLPQNACGVGQNTCGVGVGFVCLRREEGRAGGGRERAKNEKEEKEGGDKEGRKP